MANAYGDMGESDLRDYYRDKALAIADEYFKLGEKPSDVNQRLGYKNILDMYIINFA